MSLSHVLSHFPDAKKNGNGYKVRCPAHDDKTPSLSISEGEGGKVLLHCHADCELERILKTAGLVARDLFPSAAAVSPTMTTYDYRDETGVLLYQAVRREPKKFYQRRPHGNTWVNNLNGTRRVLYRLPELITADRDFPVFIAEGEKDVDRLRAIGAAATCNPQGAGKWKDEYSVFLKGFRCVILPDNDDAGESHANDVAKSLLRHGAEVCILRLPDIPNKGDVSDWIDHGGSYEDLMALLSGAETVNSDEIKNTYKRETKSRASSDVKSQQTQASQLMTLADGVELFHTPDGEAFGTIALNSHKETFPLRSGDFRRWLSYQYWNEKQAVPSSQSVQDVINGLGGRATFEGETKTVSLRIAENDGNLYLDLANDRWQCVEITKDGWKAVDNSPVKFRRTKGTMPLPLPERGGDILELRRFVNVNDDDWSLLLAWVVAAFRPNKPFPVLVLHGEQGSGKSTTAKVLRLLTDPNKSPLRSSPKDERDLMIAANNSWVISLDNLSSMSLALSDALCRLSTGGGFSTRELFSDGEEILMSLMRPIILNGIDEVISRSDLLDRAILLHLPRLSRHFDETTFWNDFDAAHPQLLGALLDAVSGALARIEGVTKTARADETDLPRLADFTLWGMAAETALGIPQSQFLARYRGNRDAVHDLVLDNDPFADSLLKFMKIEKFWMGLPSELLTKLLAVTNEHISRMRSFPKSAQAVGRRLSALAPNLREHGLDFTPPDRAKRGRTLTLRLNQSTENDGEEANV